MPGTLRTFCDFNLTAVLWGRWLTLIVQMKKQQDGSLKKLVQVAELPRAWTSSLLCVSQCSTVFKLIYNWILGGGPKDNSQDQQQRTSVMEMLTRGLVASPFWRNPRLFCEITWRLHTLKTSRMDKSISSLPRNMSSGLDTVKLDQSGLYRIMFRFKPTPYWNAPWLFPLFLNISVFPFIFYLELWE